MGGRGPAPRESRYPGVVATSRPGPSLLIAAALTAACSGSHATPRDAAVDAAPPACPAGETLATFFSLDRMHELEITLDGPGLTSLSDAPRTYVRGAVTLDGCAHGEVGVRLKGGAGSFIPLGGSYPEISDDGNGRPGKSAFIVDFNRYVSGQSHLGLEKLTINNMVQDPSFVHEHLGYALFREGGVPASRTAYARVTLNGEEKGLYLLVEPNDDDVFLRGSYGSTDGNLYEGAYGADFREPPPGGEAEWFDQDNGSDTSRSDLHAVVAALDGLGPDDDAMDVLGAHFDMDEYVTFAATEIYLGHWDGYAWSANNFKVHHDLATNRWTFLPWGIDQLFVDELGPHAGVMQGPGPAWGHGGRMHGLCMASPRCRALLARAFEGVLDRVDAMDLRSMAMLARGRVEDFALAEADAAAAVGHGGRDRTFEAWETVNRFIEGRRAAIEAWLPCLTGGRVDGDGDASDGCTEDCDDRAPDIHPGAAEVCDFVDSDCNGVIDDPPECPRCMGPEIGPRGDAFHLCFDPVGWIEARQRCLDRGQELASLHDEESWALVTFGMLERFGQPRSWIGLSDRDFEGAFSWTDGSPLDFERWCEGCPRPDGGSIDCVVTSPEGWLDVRCDGEPAAFICAEP